MAEKVYTPEVIVDVGFPQSVEGVTSTVTQGGSSGVSTPKVTQPGAFPKKMVAKELLSTVFNTVSKKILGAFEFAKSGAIQIGEYIAGVSGDIRISPAGIVARNKAGATTFALDGETGDGTFQGTIRASKFESDYFNVDEEGNVIANSIQISSASNYTAGISSHGSITSQDEVELTNSPITFTLTQPTIVLFLATFWGQCEPSSGATSSSGIIHHRIKLDSEGSAIMEVPISAEYNSVSGFRLGYMNNQATTVTAIRKLAPGTYTTSLAIDILSTSNTIHYYSNGSQLAYITLGNWS